jgi:hypothetical protein
MSTSKTATSQKPLEHFMKAKNRSLKKKCNPGPLQELSLKPDLFTRAEYDAPKVYHHSRPRNSVKNDRDLRKKPRSASPKKAAPPWHEA